MIISTLASWMADTSEVIKWRGWVVGDRTRQNAYTLVELVTICAIIGILACAVVLSICQLRGAAYVPAAAARFAAVLRESQALAQADGRRVRVTVSVAAKYSVFLDTPSGPLRIASGDLSPAKCSTNYPGGAVEFSSEGWPCGTASRSPRAGTFVFSAGGHTRSVVLQMGGCVRCR